MLISYDGCEFESEILSKPRRINGNSYSDLVLLSVKGSVLKIPESYNGDKIKTVQTNIGYIDYGIDYFEPTPDKFRFYFVEEIHIPKTVTYMTLDRMTFPNLKRVFIDPENPHYKVFENCVICCHGEGCTSNLVTYFGEESIEEFVIPDIVELIDFYAFSFTNLRSIVIPDSVKLKSIGPFMYSKLLSNFKSIVKMNGITLAIKDGLEEFVINANTVLCQSTFQYGKPKKIVLDIERLYNLPDDVYFYNDTGIDCLELRNPKVEIKSYCSLLSVMRRIEVNEKSEHYCSIDGVLFSKDRKVLLIYPDYKEDKEYVVPEGTLEIAHFAFSYNCICEAIQLHKTLRKLYHDSILQSSDLTKVVFPESIDPSFRFDYLQWNNLKEIKLPAVFGALQHKSLNLYSAAVDATEIQYFGYASVACRELYLSKKMKYAAQGAFCGVTNLYTPEFKIYNFIETLLPIKEELRRGYFKTHYLTVTRDSEKTLHLVIPIFKSDVYLEAIMSFWSIDGIDLKKYVNALSKIRKVETRNLAFVYCIEHNSDNVDFINLLLSSISRLMNNFVMWLIASNRLNLIILLCKSGVVKTTLAKKLLKKDDLSKELIPVFMELVKDCKQSYRLNL